MSKTQITSIIIGAITWVVIVFNIVLEYL